MKLEQKELGPGVVVLELIGTISIGQDCQLLEHSMETLLGNRVQRIILDLAAVQKVDSAAIGTIVASYSRVRGAGGMLRLAGVQGPVREILRMMQVDHIVPVYETTAEAAKNFETSTQAAGN